MAARPQKLTPNHREKRQEIVDAAVRVLRRDGITGCTSRAIAKEGGFNNGLNHYYFSGTDEIVDAAAHAMVDEIVAEIRATMDEHGDPAEKFWSVVEHHLTAFASQTVTWMDYWVDAVRHGRGAAIARIDDAITEALSAALLAADVPDPQMRAEAICSYVTGAAIRKETRDKSDKQVRAEIALLSGGLLPRV